jgi:hypothetical protein
VQGIAEGISFIKQLETAKSTKLGWGTYAATSHIAYAKGDPNPWGKCEGEVRASAEDILVRLWENEGDAFGYNRNVHVTTGTRHGPHQASYLFEEALPYGLPRLNMYVSFVWQALSRSRLKELTPPVSVPLSSSQNVLMGDGYVMVLRPSGISTEVGAARFSAALLLDPIAPQCTRFTYVFQLDFGSRMAGLRRFFSKKRLDATIIEDARCLLTHTMRHFQQRLPLAALDSNDARRLADALFAIRRHTMTSARRSRMLWKLCKQVLKNHIPGDFVECGVNLGGNDSMLIEYLPFGGNK